MALDSTDGAIPDSTTDNVAPIENARPQPTPKHDKRRTRNVPPIDSATRKASTDRPEGVSVNGVPVARVGSQQQGGKQRKRVRLDLKALVEKGRVWRPLCAGILSKANTQLLAMNGIEYKFDAESPPLLLDDKGVAIKQEWIVSITFASGSFEFVRLDPIDSIGLCMILMGFEYLEDIVAWLEEHPMFLAGVVLAAIGVQNGIYISRVIDMFRAQQAREQADAEARKTAPVEA